MSKTTKKELYETMTAKNELIEKLKNVIEERDAELSYWNRQGMKWVKERKMMQGKLQRMNEVLNRKDIIEVILVGAIQDGTLVEQVMKQEE